MVRNIDDDLWKKVKAQAASEGRSLRWVILRLLKVYAEQGLEQIEKPRTET